MLRSASSMLLLSAAPSVAFLSRRLGRGGEEKGTSEAWAKSCPGRKREGHRRAPGEGSRDAGPPEPDNNTTAPAKRPAPDRQRPCSFLFLWLPHDLTGETLALARRSGKGVQVATAEERLT